MQIEKSVSFSSLAEEHRQLRRKVIWIISTTIRLEINYRQYKMGSHRLVLQKPAEDKRLIHMSIPDYQSLMLPLSKSAADGQGAQKKRCRE